MKRTCRLISTVAAAALLLGMSTALAQPTSDEIVVTGARLRAEAALDAPIAVQTFSARQIEEAGIARPADFIALTPNVQFLQTTNVGETQVHIRGVIQPRDSEPSFAYVVDGVLVPNPNAFNQELVDIQSIEVIKGPIGSIYGRNAIGGAILVSTQKPGDSFEALGKVGYEFEGEEYKLAGYVSGPVTERVSARLSAGYADRQGYFENVTRRTEEDPYQELVLRARVVAELTDKIELDLGASYGEVEGYAFNFNNQFSGTPGFTGGVSTGDTSVPFAGNLESFNDQERWGVSARLSWELQEGTLSAFVARNELEEAMGGEGAADLALFGLLGPPGPGVPSPVDFFLNPALYEGYGPTDRDGAQYQERNQEDTSFEVRFVSRDDRALRYVLGAYYLDFQRDILLLSGGAGPGPASGGASQVRLAPRFSAGQAITLENGVSGTGGENDNSAYAFFGQIAYDLTDKLEASLALRYDKEERENTNNVLGRLAPSLAAPIVAPLGATRSASFDAVTPRVSLRYKPNEDVTLYATYGEGFRSGGFNPLGSRARIIGVDGVTDTAVQDAFPEEKSRSYELGAKASLLDGRLSLGGAVFYTEVENAHFFRFFPFSLARVISIVDENEIKGAEFDFTWRATDTLTIFGGGGVIDSEITENRGEPTTVGNTFPFTPENNLLLGAQYRRQVADGLDGVARIEWQRTGEMWFDTANTRGTERPEIDLVNARLSVEHAAWTASLFSRNLFDEDYNVDAVVLNVPGAPPSTFNFVTKGTPRTVGVELSYRF